MIETLSLRNFKVLREVDLRLSRLTVVVGPNSSGKSTILQALDHILDRAARRFTTVDTAWWTYGAKVSVVRISGHLAGEAFSLELGSPRLLELGRVHLLEALGRPALLKLEVRRLAAPSYPKDVALTLPSDGEGLSSILAGLALEDSPRFSRIIEQLQKVVPTVGDLTVRRARVGDLVGYELVFDMKGAKGIPAHAVSDGTLLTLGLLTVLSAPEPPRLVLIDDIERGLHPRALGDLVQQLRRLQEQDPELQIVATSHSPYLLDFLRAEEILLTSLDDDGYAAVRPLTEHPDYERWKDLMAPGEFWSAVGEKWVTEGRSK